MKQIILGTAGHIDHGKTSLVKALTGIDTDRLKEEKERGITIELGFAYLDLPSGQRLGIIDVPGHERFIKNMVAGASTIDLVALIIAADEGVMPQTREHLDICSLLGIKKGLVALTKIDMVEDDWLDLVQEDIKEFLKGTFLEGAPILPVSSTTGQGIPELTGLLERLSAEVEERSSAGIFRLPVDRVFTMKGFGTVITGTAISGSLSVGDQVIIYPQEIQAKVRGIQVHNQDTEQVRAGLRTAINLQGIEKATVNRGDVVASPLGLYSTRLLDLHIRLLKSAPRPLKHRSQIRFHSGTSEILGQVLLLQGEDIKPGEPGFGQLRLTEPVALLPGDLAVIRSYSPVLTIGGATVLNVIPAKHKRLNPEVIQQLQVLQSGSDAEKTALQVLLAGAGGVSRPNLGQVLPLPPKKLDDLLKDLLSQKVLIQWDKENKIIIHQKEMSKLNRAIEKELEGYHQANPLKPGLLKEELKSRLPQIRETKLFNFLLNQLAEQKILVQEKELVRLTGHKVQLKEDQQAVQDALEKVYLKSGLQPPYFKELVEQFPKGQPRQVLELMVKEGKLIKVKEDLYFHKQAIEGLKKKMIQWLKEKGEITTPEFKDLTQTSRKYTIPLLEYFDAIQVTMRVEDKRLLRESKELN
ncbi:MAG: selenocysteine-specific translation elongation factor [Deltaproteobacteria bacterium]|nr:selenocysteine-specific translation elongation factor [Deltaproteobacteria bacterium]